MGHKFADIAFTNAVRDQQDQLGSRRAYAALDGGVDHRDRLGAKEAAFISARDSFYIASVSETGWTYIQHRGGPPGFVQFIDDKTIGFADFRGNRQYVTMSNLQGNDKVALFFMDYTSLSRLKVLGRARLTAVDKENSTPSLADPPYRARIERQFIISIDAFDWNCSQHIVPRYTAAEIEERFEQMRAADHDMQE